MLKSTWQPIRLSLLAITFVGSALALFKIATLPKPDNTQTQPASNSLSEKVPLEPWQLIGSSEQKSNKEAKFGRQYRYRQNEAQINIDLQYMQSDGNVSRYLFVFSPVHTANANLKMKFQPGVGHYGLVSAKGQAYLTACINARGPSTVTEQQFTQNRYAYDLQVSRMVPWLLGQQSLIDSRCLWTLMSTPLSKGDSSKRVVSEEKAYQDLESAWFSWHQWWQGNFPPQ